MDDILGQSVQISQRENQTIITQIMITSTFYLNNYS